nr:uncharacterized protein LOC128692440 [Cherax quadricarinatus]
MKVLSCTAHSPTLHITDVAENFNIDQNSSQNLHDEPDHHSFPPSSESNFTINDEHIIHQRTEKILPILTVVRFPNVPCTVGSTDGTCYTGTECRQLGGVQMGLCANGFGVCCYKEITCGGSSSTNCTYLVSPNFPVTYNEARSCNMTITRMQDVCQLRLDFQAFDTFPPDKFGLCKEDQFTVKGEKKFTFLCGAAPSHWHFYLDVGGHDHSTVFTFTTSTANYNRKFKIKVSMIECSHSVPGGCGQYFTSNSGTIQSFNYGSFYLAGVNYGICFRKEKNKCKTTLRLSGPSFVRCPTDLYRLPVGDTATPSNTVINISPLGVEGLYCQLDAAPAILAPFTVIQPTLTTVSNGPLIIMHRTNLTDGFPNYHSTINCTTCAGFYQNFTHNDC